MDSSRFDQLARALATDASRRSVLGTLLATAGALLRPRTGRTACVQPGEDCRQGDACCAGHTCFEGVCDCPSGFLDARGRCAPPPPSDTTCLAEGSPCASNADCCIDDGLTCQEGVCLPAITVQVGCSGVGGPCGLSDVCCGAPATMCSAEGVCVCTDPLIPDRTGLSCVAVCGYPEDPCSDGSPCCEGAGTCVEGVCRCPDDLRPCGASCVDPAVRYRRDPKNCGSRGNACADGEGCCEGICVDGDALPTDPDHCGDCCTACHPWEICCDGTCQQPFTSPTQGNVCCEPALICAPGDGTELCCGADETCHNGGCCHVDRVCGGTCCDGASVCQCGVCVEELAVCEDDGDCCGQRCVDGVCCPGNAICPGEDGDDLCCGPNTRCGPAPGQCLSLDPGRTVVPIRVPPPGG